MPSAPGMFYRLHPATMHRILASAIFLLNRAPTVRALQRAIGAQDPIIKSTVDACFALPNLTYNDGILGYGAGHCPNLINCVMDNLSAADSAGLSAGASIACLLPTILALVGEWKLFVPISYSYLRCISVLWLLGGHRSPNFRCSSPKVL